MRLSVVVLIVLVSVTVLEASPYGVRAKDRLSSWKPKALREKETADRQAREQTLAEVKPVEKKVDETKVADDVKVEQPKAEESEQSPAASEPAAEEQPKDAGIGEQVLETAVVVVDSPVAETALADETEKVETTTEVSSDTLESVPSSDTSEPVVAQVDAAEAPAAEETAEPVNA